MGIAVVDLSQTVVLIIFSLLSSLLNDLRDMRVKGERKTICIRICTSFIYSLELRNNRAAKTWQDA